MSSIADIAAADIVSRLKANGGPTALEAAAEIEDLRKRVTALSFGMIAALSHLDGKAAAEVADELAKHGGVAPSSE